MVSSLFERGRDDPEVVGGEVAGRDCQDKGFARLYRDMVERIVYPYPLLGPVSGIRLTRLPARTRQIEGIPGVLYSEGVFPSRRFTYLVKNDLLEKCRSSLISSRLSNGLSNILIIKDLV